jgi:hypothetical protein
LLDHEYSIRGEFKASKTVPGRQNSLSQYFFLLYFQKLHFPAKDKSLFRSCCRFFSDNIFKLGPSHRILTKDEGCTQSHLQRLCHPQKAVRHFAALKFNPIPFPWCAEKKQVGREYRKSISGTLF